MTGTGAGLGSGTSTRTGVGTRTGIRAGTVAVKWMKTERRAEGGESPGTYYVVVEVVWKKRECW